MENNCQKDIEIKLLKEAIDQKDLYLIYFKLIVGNCFNETLTKDEVQYLLNELSRVIKL